MKTIPKIERGIPIPAKHKGPHQHSIIKTVNTMKIGDSMLFRTKGRINLSWIREHNPRFSFVTRPAKGGRRMWRTA